LKQSLMQMRSVLSHIVQIAMTNARVTASTYYSQLSKCSHLQLVSCVDKTRTKCHDWLQTHPTQWTTTTIQIRILFEQTTYIVYSWTYAISQSCKDKFPTNKIRAHPNLFLK
jgi:hypothetical protein